MKAITLVLINNGSNVGTYSPHAFKESFTGNIEEKTMRCLSYDDDRQVETNLYSETVVNIPDWMTEEYYLNKAIAFHWAIALTGGWAMGLSQKCMTKFLSLEENYTYFIGWLFKGKTQNQFKLSIRDQVTDWLESESYKYSTPLSPSQFEAASRYCPLYHAKQISNRLYTSNAYWNNC